MTSRDQLLLGLATLLGALGLWLMLPRGGARGRRLGVGLGLASLVLLAGEMPPLGSWAGEAVFYLLAGITVISAAAAVTFRSPVYCAIWFALSLLGTAGLFLFDGAQFLGVATIVVYAGAILVTFLFVLMLAQPYGDAFYDRISWEGLLSGFTGALLIGILALRIITAFTPADGESLPSAFTAEQLAQGVLAPEHMAGLGGQLFSSYLVSVEVAGTLLLVVLVGAVAIVIESAKSEAKRTGKAGTGRSGERLDPRLVAPDGGPDDPTLRGGYQPREEVLHG